MPESCHSLQHTELHGNVVRWGHKMSSAAACCEECLKTEQCTVWVYCDYAACADQRGECWLKDLADPYNDIDLISGRSDRWTAGTKRPPPAQGAQGARAAPTADEAQLALVTDYGRVRLRLRPKSPKAVAWVEGLLDEHTDCTGCTFYRAEAVPKHWGSLDWPDNYHGGRWGPPYALLQGGLSARGARGPNAPREDDPVVRRAPLRLLQSPQLPPRSTARPPPKPTTSLSVSRSLPPHRRSNRRHHRQSGGGGTNSHNSRPPNRNQTNPKPPSETQPNQARPNRSASPWQ